jgi:hypothetical protein
MHSHSKAVGTEHANLEGRRRTVRYYGRTVLWRLARSSSGAIAGLIATKTAAWGEVLGWRLMHRDA